MSHKTQTSIRDLIRTQKIVSAPPQTTVLHAARQMKAEGIGTLLVIDQGRLAGIFTERDALHRILAEGRDPKITLLAQVMTADPVTIAPDRLLSEALEIMARGGFRHVPVVEGGKPIGIVSIRDGLA